MKKNKPDHLQLGERGESLAFEYLLSKGYHILERNWRYSRAEIDIIYKDEETLVFVEVKTRSTDFFGQPASFVNDKKKQFVMDAASFYMEEINHQWSIRFDIIGIVIDQKGIQLNHYKDAFFSGIE